MWFQRVKQLHGSYYLEKSLEEHAQLSSQRINTVHSMVEQFSAAGPRMLSAPLHRIVTSRSSLYPEAAKWDLMKTSR